jgi:hypothetical protein
LFKNIGTPTAPSFDFITDDFAGLAGLALYVSPIYPAFGDLDNDGDQDMLVGREDGRLHYFEKIPGGPMTFQSPIANYMGIDIGKYATPQLFDIDKDGLLDIICGGQRGLINFFKNRGTASSALYDSFATNDTLGCIVIQGIGTPDGYTVPFLYDSLGNTKLLVANENGLTYQYNNINGNLTGCFNQVGTVYNKSESSRIKFNITVSGGDLNGDSLVDIVIGQSTGGVDLFYQHNPNASVSNLQPVTSFQLFPNPATDELNIRFFNLQNKNSNIKIYNSMGQIIGENKISGDGKIKVSSWAKGVYFIQLNDDKKLITKKIVIQ